MKALAENAKFLNFAKFRKLLNDFEKEPIHQHDHKILPDALNVVVLILNDVLRFSAAF